MQEQINNLQNQIDELKQALDNRDMSMELRETMRNEVVKDEQKYAQPTTTVTMTEGDDITFPTPLSKILILKWRGKEYKIPLYD